jgi:hypothetical protein
MNDLELPRGLCAAERETVIQFDDESKTVIIWSCQAPVLRKLHRLGLTPHRESRRRDTGAFHGREFRIPLAAFRWGLKRRGTPRQGAFLPKTRGQEASLSTKRPPMVARQGGGTSDAV